MAPLGLAPLPSTVDDWFRSKGLEREEIGKSLLGRPLYIYKRKNTTETSPTVLFYSLIHGNEPFGLIALLQAAEAILRDQAKAPINFVFFPIVNPDAYIMNLDLPRGCRRTNLRNVCPANSLSPPVQTCPRGSSKHGVDLNRNFGQDWELSSISCAYDYSGPVPFSEPESQALRDLVTTTPRLVASLSFHTRKSVVRDALLIHPFASRKHFNQMPAERQRLYRVWSNSIVAGLGYPTGTADEAIHYTAAGAAIDWIDSKGVYAFVLEVQPPCHDRWCNPPNETAISPACQWVFEQNRRANVLIGSRLVTLVARDQTVFESATDVVVFNDTTYKFDLQYTISKARCAESLELGRPALMPMSHLERPDVLDPFRFDDGNMEEDFGWSWFDIIDSDEARLLIPVFSMSTVMVAWIWCLLRITARRGRSRRAVPSEPKKTKERV